MDTLDPTGNIVFIFSADVSAATQWRVQDGSVWHFVDGQELSEPFAGTIECRRVIDAKYELMVTMK